MGEEVIRKGGLMSHEEEHMGTTRWKYAPSSQDFGATETVHHLSLRLSTSDKTKKGWKVAESRVVEETHQWHGTCQVVAYCIDIVESGRLWRAA